MKKLTVMMPVVFVAESEKQLKDLWYTAIDAGGSAWVTDGSYFKIESQRLRWKTVLAAWRAKR